MVGVWEIYMLVMVIMVFIVMIAVVPRMGHLLTVLDRRGRTEKPLGGKGSLKELLELEKLLGGS